MTEPPLILVTSAIEKAGNEFHDRSISLSQAYLTAYARPATDAESTRALNYIHEYKQALAAESVPEGEATVRAWQSFCRVLVSANEFIYVE